ncbi:hypothetical protein GGR56DRAFT_432858 [Xylariaceae sp. FL0804]|nr:hypothetical protein GGR56DRAFT_432858 [Xylariaceae sp. FL0804]
MNPDNSLDVQDQLPACYRCHASKVRCRRAPGQVRCRRCTRAAYSDCHPRPSRRGRIGQQQHQTRGQSETSTRPKELEEDSLPAESSNMSAGSAHELHGQVHDINADPSHALMDLIAVSVAPGGDGLSDMLWTPLVNDFDPDSLHTPLAFTPSQPIASSDAMSLSLSEPLPESITVSSVSSGRHKARDTESCGSDRRESRNDFLLELSRLSSASYMQALTDLNAQMLSQQDGMLECIRQFLASPTRQSQGSPPTGPGERSPGASIGSDTALAPISEGPVEAALRLGLALRSLLRPHQTCGRDMPTALFLLSTVLRLASLLHDLLARLQGMLAQVTNMNALCAYFFPPVRLGSLLLDERDDDRLRPLQMHSIAMALSTAEGLIDEVIQLTESALPDHINHAFGAVEDGDGNMKDEFGLQAFTHALVAKQEAVVESISGLRDMLCC